MSEKKQNLNESELATIDSMIAYLQESNKKTIDNTFDNIFAVNNNCFNVATPANVISVQVAAPIYAVSTCISGLIGTGAGGVLKQGAPELENFFEKLSNGKDELSLDELIAIRNKKQ